MLKHSVILNTNSNPYLIFNKTMGSLEVNMFRGIVLVRFMYLITRAHETLLA